MVTDGFWLFISNFDALKNLNCFGAMNALKNFDTMNILQFFGTMKCLFQFWRVEQFRFFPSKKIQFSCQSFPFLILHLTYRNRGGGLVSRRRVCFLHVFSNSLTHSHFQKHKTALFREESGFFQNWAPFLKKISILRSNCSKSFFPQLFEKKKEKLIFLRGRKKLKIFRSVQKINCICQ